MPCPGLQKPCKVSCWPLDSSLAVAWLQRLRLLCLCLGQGQAGNPRLTPTVWWRRPQTSPRLSWPALLAWDRGSFPFPMHPPYPCWGRQWNSAPSQMVFAIANDCSCEVMDHGGALVTGYYAWWARCFACFHLRDSLLNHINGGWAFHWWFVRQVAWSQSNSILRRLW